MGGFAVSSQRMRFVWIPITCDHRTAREIRRKGWRREEGVREGYE